MHIASWALTIILYVIAFLHISESQGPTPMFKPLQMALRVFMLLTLFSGFWLLIQEFMVASHGGGEQPYVVNIEDALWYSGSCTNGSIYC